VSSGARKYARREYLTHLVKAAVESYPDLPIALHLDHGDTFELCKACVDDGFSSVMIDASHETFEMNVRSPSRWWNTPTPRACRWRPSWAS